jgi:hypothetical protein
MGIKEYIKINKDELWLWITYGCMSLAICVLMIEVSSLKDEIKQLKETKIKK